MREIHERIGRSGINDPTVVKLRDGEAVGPLTTVCRVYLNGKHASDAIEAQPGADGWVREERPCVGHAEHVVRERRHGHVRVIEYAPGETVLDVLPEGFEVATDDGAREAFRAMTRREAMGSRPVTVVTESELHAALDEVDEPAGVPVVVPPTSGQEMSLRPVAKNVLAWYGQTLGQAWTLTDANTVAIDGTDTGVDVLDALRYESDAPAAAEAVAQLREYITGNLPPFDEPSGVPVETCPADDGVILEATPATLHMRPPKSMTAATLREVVEHHLAAVAESLGAVRAFSSVTVEAKGDVFVVNAKINNPALLAALQAAGWKRSARGIFRQPSGEAWKAEGDAVAPELLYDIPSVDLGGLTPREAAKAEALRLGTEDRIRNAVADAETWPPEPLLTDKQVACSHARQTTVTKTDIGMKATDSTTTCDVCGRVIAGVRERGERIRRREAIQPRFAPEVRDDVVRRMTDRMLANHERGATPLDDVSDPPADAETCVDGPKLMAYIERLEASIREMHVPGCFSAHGVACECGKDALEAAGYESEEEGEDDPPDPAVLQRIFDAPAPPTLGDGVYVRLPGYDDPFFAEVTKAGAAPEVMVMGPGPVSVLPIDVCVSMQPGRTTEGVQRAVVAGLSIAFEGCTVDDDGRVIGSDGKPVTVGAVEEAARAMAGPALCGVHVVAPRLPRFGLFWVKCASPDGGPDLDTQLDLDDLVTRPDAPEEIDWMLARVRAADVVRIIRHVADRGRYGVPQWLNDAPLWRRLLVLAGLPEGSLKADVVAALEREAVEDEDDPNDCMTDAEARWRVAEEEGYDPDAYLARCAARDAAIVARLREARDAGRSLPSIQYDAVLPPGDMVGRSWRLESLTTDPSGAVADVLASQPAPGRVVEAMVAGAPLVAIVGKDLHTTGLRRLRDELVKGGADPKMVLITMPEGIDLVRLVAVEG